MKSFLKTPQAFISWLVPIFCLVHMAAISWWTLPHSFSSLVLASAGETAIEAKLFRQLALGDDSYAKSFFQYYIDITGSQQYWDFFGPFSPKSHQYLSVCEGIAYDPGQEKIACLNKPLFSNLDNSLNNDSEIFKPFGSDRSRFYRLTETLINLDEPILLTAFTNYYRFNQRDKITIPSKAYLVLHTFELYPNIKDLPKSGYRVDRMLLALP